jgi:AbrB family looped-hinge helix DNA binding protein
MAKNKPGESDVRYEVITQEDPETGDIILPIPEPILKQMGWKEGDELDISVDSDGKLFIKKT